MTCRHYRFQIPREEADELRAADPLPCPVCDNRSQRNFQMLDWSPHLIQASQSGVRGGLLDRVRNWFAPAPHAVHPAPARVALG